ncbi:hypothetical protein DL771_006783 [Monosporascus sp. 5C6A]|nr:hypothetical protein DL771_006783 [Monosporascus sp. 5C6A]
MASRFDSAKFFFSHFKGGTPIEATHAGSNGRILTKASDVSKPEDVKARIDATVEKCGPLDGAANVAGKRLCGGTWRFDGDDVPDASLAKMNDRIRPIETLPLSDLQEMLNMNVFGTFNCLQEKTKNSKRGGSIANCCSQQVRHALGLMSTYAASKNTVYGLSVAYEGGPKGIRVNLLCPCTMTEGDHLPSIKQRYAKPEEITTSIAFLLGDESKFVTKQECKKLLFDPALC